MINKKTKSLDNNQKGFISAIIVSFSLFLAFTIPTLMTNGTGFDSIAITIISMAIWAVLYILVQFLYVIKKDWNRFNILWENRTFFPCLIFSALVSYFISK